MNVINQKKLRLVNDETSMRNPDFSTGIYFTAAKVAKCRLMSENRGKRVETK